MVALCSLLKTHAQPFLDFVALDRLKSEYGEAAFQRGERLNQLLLELKTKDTKTKLLEVNRFFNQARHRFDQEVWGESDYWATPEEFIGRHTGDCEDFVIAKYFTLRYLGIADEHLYLTYVKALKQNIAHMVLSYFETPQSIPLVLDNYDLRILSADKRTDLLPIYSFNAESLFLTNASAGLGKRLPTDKVKNSKWTKLLGSLKEAVK
ncbi:MAG: transglutaminase [Oleiphilus sp.]|nr:MAG: transglutaminase [Oleiphilus sp.]